jgi:hypothetical protein
MQSFREATVNIPSVEKVPLPELEHDRATTLLTLVENVEPYPFVTNWRHPGILSFNDVGAYVRWTVRRLLRRLAKNEGAEFFTVHRPSAPCWFNPVCWADTVGFCDTPPPLTYS